MNRSHLLTKTMPIEELNRKTAIHEAGHAAAIYLGNKQKQLPSVFFQIVLHTQPSHTVAGHCGGASIEGGRLIHSLPLSIETATCEFSTPQKLAYQQAFESDIINLLVGPLAEANYIAQRDGEPISPCLVNLDALPAYGGASDLKIIHDYLECFIIDMVHREQKIAELFLAAFNFISHWPHWFAIDALANYILISDKPVIAYEEIADVLETYFLTANRQLQYRAARC